MQVDAGGPILFDLDGTLVALGPPADELEDLREGLLRIARSAGVDPSSHSILQIYDALVQNGGRDAAPAVRARELLDAAEVSWADTATPLHAGWELPTLRNQGSLLGLVTSNGRRCVDALIANAKLPDAFSGVVTRDEVTSLKPSAEPLVQGVALLESAGAVGPFLFVGDSATDEEAVHSFNARSRGAMRFVRVGGGNCTVTSFAAALAGQADRGELP